MPNEIIKFKSTPEMYEKEITGKKPNTLREIEPGDKRFKALKKDQAKIIVIENTETKETFDRTITDYTEWKGWAIISWDPNEDKQHVPCKKCYEAQR